MVTSLKEERVELFRNLIVVGLFLVSVFGFPVGYADSELGYVPPDDDNFTQLAPKAPEVGSKAPDFTARDEKGDVISLGELERKGRVVLVFYRGIF